MIVLCFAAFVCIAVYMDIRAHRSNDPITLKDATHWSLFYVGLALLFALLLFFVRGTSVASTFLSGYVLEKALSVDNLLVFGSVFAYFKIQPGFHHRILHFGILGAVVFRLIFVFLGTSALWMIGKPVEFIFGLFIAWSAWKLVTSGDDNTEEVDHASRWYIKWTQRFFWVTADASQNRFFSPVSGLSSSPFNKVMAATPLFLCLIAIEITDVMFSFDSVPAVISITHDAFLAYSSMIFAVLGLRSMYFVIEALKRNLTHIGSAVSVVLCFVAAKLILHAVIGLEIDPSISLAFVLATLGCGVISSMKLIPAKE